MSILSDRAVLVRPHIRVFEGSRIDRKASDEVTEANEATRGSHRVYKSILADDTRKPIESAATALRQWVKQECLPWAWSGVALCPNENYFHFMEGWRARHHDFEQAYDFIVNNWEAHVVLGRHWIGKRGAEVEYPTLDQVKRMYSAEIEVYPVPAAADFRADLPEDEAERIRQQIEENSQREIQQAHQFLWEGMAECVTKVVDGLRDYGRDAVTNKVHGVFRDSLIGNLRLMVERVARLNITKDPEIDRIAQKLKTSLCVEEPQTLRDDANVRKSVLDEAERIAQEMAAVFGTPAI